MSFDDTQAYYVEAAELMREYVQARFDLRACEMTTEELVGHDTTQRVLETGQRGTLFHFLKHCDLVKFARYTPPPPQRKEMLERAEGFVLETQGVERA